MADCQMLKNCVFFNDKMAEMPSMSKIFKIMYCTGDSSECARLMVRNRLGKDGVPPDLFPNQCDRAREIIEAAQ